MADGTKKISIGRDAACDLVITDRSVSRRHAELTVEAGGALEIKDLDSSGGTYLIRDGREELVSRARLQRTDSVKLGEYEISVYEILMRAQKVLGRAASPVAEPPAFPQGRMVRCSCGTIKKRGEACPSCGL